MFKGFYTASSGMLAQQRRTEMLTNNLSNANTPGFKADQSSVKTFPQMLLKRMDQNTNATNNRLTLPTLSQVGQLSTGVYLQETTPLFSQGDLRETESKTDFSLSNGTMPINNENGINGTVLFTIEQENGELRYTRNGSFTLDGAGYLTTASGDYVLDENNERILLNSENFTMNEAGFILENNQPITRLGVSFASNPYQLVKVGEGLFRAEAGAGMENAYTTEGVSFSLKQGFIESSNVDEAQTMTDMMTAYRSFEANQKIVQAYDKSMDKAVNEIGRL
jgi:flagellar basal-body rod protein FlgF